MTLRVYLDVNHWITLSRVRKGLDHDPVHLALYGQISRLSRSGEIVVPFSLFTAIETSRYRKRGGYRELVDVLVDLSRGYVLKPASYFLGMEIENAMRGLVGKKPIYDIRSEIIGRGPADMTKYTLSDIEKKIPPGLHHAFQYVLNRNDCSISERFEALRSDAGALKACLTDEDFFSDVREAYSGADKVVSDAEAKRHKNSGIGKEEFERLMIVDDLNDLLGLISIWTVRQCIHVHEIKHLLTLSSVERLRRSMPAHHTRFTLTRARDRMASKPFNINDLLDVAHLAAAIPYTDVVVTDKLATRLATSEKLDEMYDCVVLDDLKGLAGVPPFRLVP